MRQGSVKREEVFRVIKEFPGVTCSEIRELLPNIKNVAAHLSLLFSSGAIRREGNGGRGRNKNGYKYYIMPNNTPPQQVQSTDRPTKLLSDYTPRELLEELKRRGYVWEKMWVKQYVEYNKI